ncbi:amidase [Amycolatopsis sp. CA-230715]|uniref:amidase n=1 Tax=Amycolatopsis sp. CA-230715 TaxID=2745196 RepID=UPI001C0123DC|nr:amidase [Amycolatopsis sp. CA-230715]QWF84136.1 Putative amidase AmiD [Amycolatopsis sp. CA-230715]
MTDHPSENEDLAEVLRSPIRTVRGLFDRGELSPLELTEAALERIERRNPSLGALTHVAPEHALEASRAATERLAHGETRGPLDGVVVAVKDLVAVEGMPLEAGSRVLAGNTARRDAAVVASLRAAGAVVVGKAALDEFALTTVGPARNPLDESLSPGGSSGGSASAVRAGMCFAAIGTDTGGSVRVPAYCCAITGLKPTHGLLPTDGVIPLAPSLDHVGTLARTAEDTALFLESLLPVRPKGFRPRTPDQASYRIGIPDDLSGYQPAVRERFTAVVDRAWRHGARISPLRFPDLDEVKAAHWTILSSELSAYHRHRFGEDEDRYDRPMRDAIAAGALVSTEQYLDAQRTRGELRRQVDALFAGMDLLAVPTMTVEPPCHGQTAIMVDGIATDPTTAMVRGTSLFNHTGHPALSVPPGAGSRGESPCGIQLVAPFFAERTLLDAARAFED